MTASKTPTVDEFVEKCLNQFLFDIKDRIFLMIQDDRGLMQEYLALVRDKNDKQLNTKIGKLIKAKLKIDDVLDKNKEPVEGEPQSSLIKSYTQHCLGKASASE